MAVSAPPSAELEIRCARCGRSFKTKVSKAGGLKLPRGWHRHIHPDDSKTEAVCSECWDKAYLLRALTFAVAEPLSGTWEELEAELKTMWSQTTAACNWMATECYARDVRRHDEAKMPPMGRVYLYPEARVKFPDLPPQTIVSLEQAVQRKYRAKRYDVIWTCSASLPNFRYPQPFPQHNQSWSFAFNEAGQSIVSVRLGDKRWEVRLKGGKRYARQTAGLKKMEHRGELALYKAHDGTILCKLVGWLERPTAARGLSGSLNVRTAVDNLLVAVDAKDERIWIENCDHLRRWIAQHNRKLQRLAEDQKAEQRPHPSFENRRSDMVEKQHRRVKSAIQEVAAHIANFAARRKFAQVVYDDSEKGFMGAGFPYFQLADRLAMNLDERGILFEKKIPASGGSEEKTPQSLADGEEE
jgi:hypothetical protein